MHREVRLKPWNSPAAHPRPGAAHPAPPGGQWAALARRHHPTSLCPQPAAPPQTRCSRSARRRPCPPPPGCAQSLSPPCRPGTEGRGEGRGRRRVSQPVGAMCTQLWHYQQPQQCCMRVPCNDEHTMPGPATTKQSSSSVHTSPPHLQRLPQLLLGDGAAVVGVKVRKRGPHVLRLLNLVRGQRGSQELLQRQGAGEGDAGRGRLNGQGARVGGKAATTALYARLARSITQSQDSNLSTKHWLTASTTHPRPLPSCPPPHPHLVVDAPTLVLVDELEQALQLLSLHQAALLLQRLAQLLGGDGAWKGGGEGMGGAVLGGLKRLSQLQVVPRLPASRSTPPSALLHCRRAPLPSASIDLKISARPAISSAGMHDAMTFMACRFSLLWLAKLLRVGIGERGGEDGVV